MKNQLTQTKVLNTLEIPKSLRWMAKILHSISSDLTILFAAKIFMTPLRFKTPEREQMMRESANNKLVEINGISGKIMVYTYGYSKKKVMLVHGWSGRGTQLYQIADKILENKMMVVSFDAPAHGLSEGKITNLMEYLKTIEHINKAFGPFEAAIGHSFGGMALLNAVSRGLKLNKLVIIGTDNSIPEIIKNFVHKLNLKPSFAQKLESYSDRKIGLNTKDHSAEFVAQQIDIPTLVLHDSKDKFVPVSSALVIRQNLKHGELLMTHGLGHHKIFKNKHIIQRIIDFII